MSDRRHELARRARREQALARPEFRKAPEAVVVRASRGATSPVVREIAEELQEAIAAFRRGGRDAH